MPMSPSPRDGVNARPDARADESSGTPASDGVLDPQALANLAQLDPTGANRLVQRVLTTFRSSMARLLAQLTHARMQPDPAALKLVVHTLKSSAASVGAVALSSLCAEAERQLREGQLDTVEPLLDQLLAEAQRVDDAVLQLLNEPS